MSNDRDTNQELFKMLHSLQYDRINKIESQNNYITSFVTGLSTLTIAYSFKGTEQLTIINGFVLPIIFVLANFIAICFLFKVRKFIKMHQIRAKEMRKTFAPDFHKIYEDVGKDSNGKFAHRTGYMVLLHILISAIGVGITISYLANICPIANPK